MFHDQILIKNISLLLPGKTCFSDFSATIQYRDRIGVIGRNGTGKSTLLKMIAGLDEPTLGDIVHPNNLHIGYVPQIITQNDDRSGAERFQKALGLALAGHPNILLLDEPTNHLDEKKRLSLIRMLNKFQGTVVLVTHDEQLLRECFTTIWDIDYETVSVANILYDAYREKKERERIQYQKSRALAERAKKKLQQAIEKEHQRAHKIPIKQKSDPDKSLRRGKQQMANQTAGKKGKLLRELEEEVADKFRDSFEYEEVVPQFRFSEVETYGKAIIVIRDGACGYSDHEPILSGINGVINRGDRVALLGDNGSGKTTLLRALLDDSLITKTGEWIVSSHATIGYLDQHYRALKEDRTVFDAIRLVAPAAWTDQEVRKLCNNFLFRSNDEVNKIVGTCSGGEKARILLATLCAQSPTLLFLDEITNNIDRETKEQVIATLNAYRGTMIVISHDKPFLDRIGITRKFLLREGTLSEIL